MKRDQCSYNAIATTCPLEYGSAVYQAQALYQLIDPWTIFQDDDQCNIQAARKANPIKPTKKIKKGIALNESANTASFSIYPNPSDGNFKINCSSTLNNATIEVINTLGEVVYKNTNASLTDGSFIVVLKGVNTGIYHVRVISSTDNFTKSIVINKQ